MARKINKGKKKKTKTVKKRWVKILAPQLFQKQVIGETFVVNAEKAVGKTITTSLMNLTKDPKKQNIFVSFHVTGLDKDGAANTEFYRFQLSVSAVKRMARRHKDKIADSIEVRTGDKKLVRIKPIIITRHKVSKPTQSDIRLKAREFIAYKLSKQPVENLTQELINKKFQRSLSDILRKIAPISNCEIRDFFVLPERKVA